MSYLHPLAFMAIYRCQPTFHMDINSWCSRQISGHSKVSVILHYGGSVCSQTAGQICSKICFQSIFQARIAEVFGIIIHSMGLGLRLHCSACEIYTATLARRSIWSQITLLCCESQGVSGRSASWMKKESLIVYTCLYWVYVRWISDKHVDPYHWWIRACSKSQKKLKPNSPSKLYKKNSLCR